MGPASQIDLIAESTQRWHLLAPVCAEKIKMPPEDQNDSCELLHDYLDTISSSNMFELLARPDPPSASAVVGSSIMTSHKLSSIEMFPAELLATILSIPTLSPRDIITFGISSCTLWQHALKHIHADIRRSAGCWAGTPLLCSGTWLEDLPPAVYALYPGLEANNDTWHEELRRPHSQIDSRMRIPSRSLIPQRSMCPARRWNWDTICRYTERPNSREIWRKAVADVVPTKSAFVREPIADVLRIPYRSIQSPWVLRNLDRSEFVRLSVIQSPNGGDIHASVQDAPGISLDKTLLLRICWSDDNPVWAYDMEEECLLRRGNWAGHSFDVVSSTEASCAGFEDVTEALIKHAVRVGLSERIMM